MSNSFRFHTMPSEKENVNPAMETCMKDNRNFESSMSIQLRDGIVNAAKKSNNLETLVFFLSNLPDKINTSACFEQTETNESGNDSLEWLKVPFIAVEQNRCDVLQLCIKSGVNLSKLYPSELDSMNVLMKALSIENVNNEIVELLISHIDINERKANVSALNICINNNSIEPRYKLHLVTKLLKAGANFSTKCGLKFPAIHSYLGKSSLAKDDLWKKMIDVFLSHGQDVNEKDMFGQTPLIATVESTQADWDDDRQEYTDVVDSITQMKLDIIEYLLEQGANPDIQKDDGCSCIHMATIGMNRKAVRLLLEHKCDANAVNKLGMTAIYLCFANHYSRINEIEYVQFVFPIIDLLITFGCDINAKGIDQSTVLHYAAAKCKSYVCDFLCSMGANVDAEDYQQLTPLHMAARNNNDSIVEVLVKHGANVNSKDVNHETPLHFACLMSNLPVVTSLVEHGASVEVRAQLGIIPLHLAAENGDTDLIQYLLGVYHETCLGVKDNYGATPLHYAASNGNPETVEELLRSDADKNIHDNSGMAPLNLAQYNGHLRATTLLADDEADIKFGRLPIKCFPNRPLIMEEEVDEYFKTLKEQLVEDNNHGQEFARHILDSPGLGKVDLKSGEARIISEKVVDIVRKIARRIGELDDTFECTILRAGSTHEGVKTGYPDEFDFVCNVNKFSEHIHSLFFGETEGFTQIRLNESAPKAMLEYCSRSSLIVNAMCFQRRFSQLARLAAYDVCGQGVDNIYGSTMLLPENYHVFLSTAYVQKKLYGMDLAFRGQEHKHLGISVDLNPVLFTNSLPQKVHTELAILPKITNMGIYLIPKHCTQANLDRNRTEVLSPESDLWRYSTHHLEAEIMHNLPQTGRDCYILCKAFRMEPLTCSINNKQSGMLLLQEDIDQHMGQVMEIDDSEEQHECGEINLLVDDSLEAIKHEHDKMRKEVINNVPDAIDDNGECDEVIPDYIDTIPDSDRNRQRFEDLDVEVADEDENEHIEPKADVLDRESEHIESNDTVNDIENIIYEDDEGSELNDSNNDNDAENSEEVDSENTDVMNDVYDDEESDDGEMTAEHVIPSYYLKSIFIKEAEEMLQRGEEWNESSLTKIPRIVYEKLLEAFDKEHLTTLFMPSHNVLYKRQDDKIRKDNVRIARLRTKYCKHILSVMDVVGFDLHNLH